MWFEIMKWIISNKENEVKHNKQTFQFHHHRQTHVAYHKAFVKVSSMQIGIDTLGLTVMSIIFKASIFKLKRPFLMTWYSNRSLTDDAAETDDSEEKWQSFHDPSLYKGGIFF